MRVLVAIEPVDGRKGIDSLARLCQEKLAEDPFSGCVFVFRSPLTRGARRRSRLRVGGCQSWVSVKIVSRRPTGVALVGRYNVTNWLAPKHKSEPVCGNPNRERLVRYGRVLYD